MMKLRRGFKSQAAGLAGELRAELGLSPFDRLDPHQLAAHLAIPIVPLSERAASSDGARHSLSTDSDFFSALTVFDGYRRMIVHNDSHSEVRQNSNLAHELAHGLLLHEPAPPLDGVTGCRIWNDTNEEEAAWLSGALLVTGKMALAVARGRFTEQQTLQRLRVSASMLDWRINMSGARKKVGRERASERRFLILSSVVGRTGQNQEQGLRSLVTPPAGIGIVLVSVASAPATSMPRTKLRKSETYALISSLVGSSTLRCAS